MQKNWGIRELMKHEKIYIYLYVSDIIRGKDTYCLLDIPYILKVGVL